tara:strand:+ start:269 stop:502 length:234 start_codon:yes stop_codon:yes gene_type:complete
MAKLILYNLPGCPYCKRVIDFLDKKGLKYDIKDVPPNKQDRTEVIEISGQTDVPVLVDGDKIIDDDDNIIPYLEENY